VCSSPTGTLEPSRGDIDVSVDKVCNWLAQECQASVNPGASIVTVLGHISGYRWWSLLSMATVTPATCRNRWHKQMASDRLGPVLLWPRRERCRLMPVDEARWRFVQTLLCRWWQQCSG